MKRLSLFNSIRFCFSSVIHQHGHSPYSFSGYYDKAKISYNDMDFCVVEDITRIGEVLKISHFSVHDNFRGARIGKKCLRKFATHIDKIAPTINTIDFSLSKLPITFPQAKVAQARLHLLNEIGATNTSMIALPQGKFLVTGSWNKDTW
jgi:hypothetical protein